MHTFNGLFSRTTWVSRYQEGKTSLDLNERRNDGVSGWQWHQLDHMQTVCTSLQTETTPTPYHSMFTGRMLFLTPNQQRQSTEGSRNMHVYNKKSQSGKQGQTLRSARVNM